MTTVAIVQARMGSTRLPGKVLERLGERPVLAWVIEGAAAISGVDCAVVATSDKAQDDPIAAWCDHAGVRCHRGPEDDVLARYAMAAESEGADVVVRITADCPFIDPEVCGMVLARLSLSGADYASNVEPRSWPDGLDCEAFTAEALRTSAEHACKPAEREHVTPYLRNNRHRFSHASVPCPIPGLGRHRWTLDTPEDLTRLRELAASFPSDHRPSWIELLNLAEKGIGAAGSGGAPADAEAGKPTRRSESHEEPDEAHSRYAASQTLLERARRSVPLGSQTFSKSHLQFPCGAAPLFLTHGEGGRVWDVDGNEYVDLVGGLLPIVLGYRDADVDQAIRDQMTNGISFSLATELEVALAERLVEIIPCAEMVRFGKNGTDATSAAIRVARASTGRDRVAICGYHGWQDWYVGVTSRNKGVPGAVSALSHTFPYNDLDALQRLLDRHPGEFAAVIMEPVTFAEPEPGYLAEVRELAHRHGAIFIFDEVITGFRFALGGAQEYFGVTPDLACFGKAMGNGMPISALVGRAELMSEMEEIFISSTFAGETLSLAAAIAVIDKMRREPVINRLWKTGRKLAEGARALVAEHGLDAAISIGGLAPWHILAFHDRPGGSAPAIKTVFLREMLANGVLVAASHNVCDAHGEAEIDDVLNAYGRALPLVSAALQRGDLDDVLGESVIQPVFSVR